MKRVIVCSGKVYYDLRAEANETQKDRCRVIRVAQLYPFPHEQFEAQIERYPNATEVVWCQEEPQNQGAWYRIQHYFRENMRDDQKLYYAGRRLRPRRRRATRRCTTSSRRRWSSRLSASTSSVHQPGALRARLFSTRSMLSGSRGRA